jgi:hypothetical protein
MMKTKISLRFSCILVIMLVFSVITGITSVFAAAPASADVGGLKISGAIVNRVVIPGETIEHRMTISLGSDSPVLDVTIEIMGLGQKENGSYRELTPEEDISPHTSREYIVSVEPASFSLKPGGEQTVTAVIKVPQTIGDGSLYAVLYVKGTPGQQVGIVMIPAVDIPVILNHGILNVQGDISSINVGKVVSGQPITVDTLVENSGNTHFKATNKVNLLDSAGNILAYSEEQTTPCSIIPNYSFKFTRNIIITGNIEPGIYNIQSQVNLENGGSLVEMATLDLTEQYQMTTTAVTSKITKEYQSKTPEEEKINWAFIGIVMGGLVLLGLLVLLVTFRRRKTQ